MANFINMILYNEELSKEYLSTMQELASILKVTDIGLAYKSSIEDIRYSYRTKNISEYKDSIGVILASSLYSEKLKYFIINIGRIIILCDKDTDLVSELDTKSKYSTMSSIVLKKSLFSLALNEDELTKYIGIDTKLIKNNNLINIEYE